VGTLKEPVKPTDIKTESLSHGCFLLAAVLWHDELLYNLMEGRMVWKPTRSGRRLQMLEDLCENNSYKVLKRTFFAWRDCMRKKLPKTCCATDN